MSGQCDVCFCTICVCEEEEQNTKNKLDEIREEAKPWFESNIGFGEIGANEFAFWLNNISYDNNELDPKKFDLYSAMGIFEMWVKYGGYEIKSDWK